MLPTRVLGVLGPEKTREKPHPAKRYHCLEVELARRRTLVFHGLSVKGALAKWPRVRLRGGEVRRGRPCVGIASWAVGRLALCGSVAPAQGWAVPKSLINHSQNSCAHK